MKLFPKIVLGMVALIGLTSNGLAQLRFTEAMSSSANNSQDWFELTNYGNVTVTLDSNWRVDDTAPSFATSIALNTNSTISVAPGESVVFIEGASSTIASFISLWNLSGVQVGNYSGSGIGLSSGGDALNLFSGTSITTGVTFGAATAGKSFYWTYSNDVNTSQSGGPTVSVSGQFGAVTRGSDVGSPGVALPLTSPTTLQWVGGSGTWNASGGTNWQGGAWDSSKTAVFATTSGTVSLNENVSSLGLDFRSNGYVVSGSGSINTGQVSVVNATDTATLNVVMTGSQGLTKFGSGTLALGAHNTYSGPTSVSQGTVKSLVDDAIADASTLSVARLATYDFNGHSDTVNGISGLGTINMGSGTLTAAVTGTSDVVFNGSLHGSGDFIVDGTGGGDVDFNTTGQSLADGAVKDYTGQTIIRNGTLRVNETAVPIATSGVLIEGGKLRLTTQLAEYTFGNNASVAVVLAGGAIRQDDGESVTLKNNISVTAASALESHLDTLDPLSAPVLTLTGAISGTGGLAIKSGGMVDIETGGSYSGTLSVQGSKLRVNGVLAAGSVVLDAGSTLSGSGKVKTISGAGKIGPGNSPGILTAESVDPSGGTGFVFEFTDVSPNYSDATTSLNDVLHLTGPSALGAGLSSANTVEIFLSVASLNVGDLLKGGFYLDQAGGSFDSLVQGASYAFYIYGDGAGTDAFLDGFGFYLASNYDPSLGFAISTVAQSADFGAGTVNGSVMQLAVVPEPGVVSLVLIGLLLVLWGGLRRRPPVLSRPFTNCAKGGFTLIELLATVAIIGVLAALLFPFSSSMLNKGKDTKCLNNLRQLGVAVTCYLTDSNGELPYEGAEETPTWGNTTSAANATSWYNVLPPYISFTPLKSFTTAQRSTFYTSSGGSILQCPRATWNGNEKSASGPIFSYAFNSKIFSGTESVKIFQLVAHDGVNVNNRMIGASSVPMLLDGRASTKEPKAVAGMNNDFGTPQAYTRRLSNRHGAAYTTAGTANIVFFDGSVRSFKASDLMDSSGRNITTSPVIWDPANPDDQ